MGPVIKSIIEYALIAWLTVFWVLWFSCRPRAGKLLAINVMSMLILGIVAVMTMLLSVTTTHDLTALDWTTAMLLTVSTAWLVVETKSVPRPPYPH